MERTKCPSCGAAVLERLALDCDRCGIMFSEWDKAQSDRLERLSREFNSPIVAQVRHKLWKDVAFLLLVLGFLGYGSVYEVRRQLQSFLATQIAEQFDAPRIRATLEEAAASRAADLIETEIAPAIDKAKQTVRHLEVEFADDIEGVRREYRHQLEDLRGQVEYLRKSREIQRLQEQAIEGDPAAFERLDKYVESDPDLELAARAAMVVVKGVYSQLTIGGNLTLSNRLPDGSRIEDHDVSTPDLVKILDGAADSKDRVRAAHLLRTRREVGVPELLLKAMRGDGSLWVRRAALTAFSEVSGWEETDVFGFDSARAWYEEHQNEIRQRLKEPPPRN